MGEAVFLY